MNKDKIVCSLDLTRNELLLLEMIVKPYPSCAYKELKDNILSKINKLIKETKPNN